MAISLSVGSCTFQFPEQNTKSGWGEEVTCWALAVTNKLNTISGTYDLNLTTVCISNGVSSATNVGSGACAFLFPSASVRSFDATYTVLRTDCCCVNTVETGTILGVYNGSAWTMSIEQVGCAGICLQITSAGQIQYFSDSEKGPGTIKFKASTKAQ